MGLNSPLVRSAICLVVLLSPIGAPVVGALIGICPPDGAIGPTGPFAMGFAYCGVSRPIEQFYQHAVVLSMLPMVFAGPIFGGLVTIAWWFVACGSAAGCVWHLWRAIVSVSVEKL